MYHESASGKARNRQLASYAPGETNTDTFALDCIDTTPIRNDLLEGVKVVPPLAPIEVSR